MPLLNNIVSSIKIGWNNLNNDDNLTMLTFLSVSYIFLIFTNHSLMSDAIFIGYIFFLGISIQFSTLFISLLAFSACVSVLIGSIFKEKYHHRLHIFSSLSGLAFGFLLYLPIQGEFWLFFYPIIGGVVAGIGIPNILAAFLSKTNFNNRGSSSSIFVTLIFLILFIFTILINELDELAIVLVVLKIFSIFLSIRVREFSFSSETLEFAKTTKMAKYQFLMVWAIFIISDISVQTYLRYLVSQGIITDASLVPLLQFISQIIGLFTLFLGGILMDIYGRKRLLMFSFAYLGANYALISLSRGFLFYFTPLEGIAWGILTVFFLLILWGDVCKPKERTGWISLSLCLTILTYPALIIIPYFVNTIQIIKDQGDLFPITSIFLFIAVVIILYLPETLPEKIIQKKELDDYIRMAKKVKQKYKNGKKS